MSGPSFLNMFTENILVIENSDRHLELLSMMVKQKKTIKN